MSDGSQTVETSEETVESGVTETALGGREFKGSIESKDPLAPKTIPAPDGIPEKFWDTLEGKLRTDDLVKSYQALESKLHGKKDDEEEVAEKPEGETEEKPEEETEEKPEGETEEKPEGETQEQKPEGEEVSPSDFKDAIETARKVYAETGDLPEDARQPFLDAGFSNQQIDLYLAGVKATEAALETAAHKAAGSAEDYAAAVEWAANGGLTPKQIEAFNAQTGDVELIGPAVAGLMSAFRKSNPGEGKLVNTNSGLNRGDVYESMDEFQQDLSKADHLRDKVARKKAIEKLRRSREAGTIKHSNRRQPFGG